MGIYTRGKRMSVDALNWAWTAPVESSAQRLVLLSLADRAGEHHTCYPSNSRLAKDTVLNIKTVQKVVNQLIDLGLVADTGKKMGTTNKVRVLKLVGVQSREQNQNRDSYNEPKKGLIDNDNEPKNGAIKHTQKGVNSAEQTNPILEGNEPKNGIVNDPNFGVQNLPINLSMNLSCQHEWIPNQNQLIGVLQQKGHGQNLKFIFGLPSFEFELGAFNAHFDGQVLSDAKKLYKFANWISDKFERHVKLHPEYIEVSQPEQPQQAPSTEFKGIRKSFKGMDQ